MKKIEYRVRPVMRYIVTEYSETDEFGQTSASVRTIGEFDGEQFAEEVMRAMVTQARADNPGYKVFPE